MANLDPSRANTSQSSQQTQQQQQQQQNQQQPNQGPRNPLQNVFGFLNNGGNSSFTIRSVSSVSNVDPLGQAFSSLLGPLAGGVLPNGQPGAAARQGAQPQNVGQPIAQQQPGPAAGGQRPQVNKKIDKEKLFGLEAVFFLFLLFVIFFVLSILIFSWSSLFFIFLLLFRC